MIEIAPLAGFRSLRRFNAVFAEVYKRPPSTIRRILGSKTNARRMGAR
jgi:AraC family transcriptional regulator of adaptative response / DNA-3-methyladenine glycosylase II